MLTKIRLSSHQFALFFSLLLFLPYNLIFFGKLWQITASAPAFIAVSLAVWLLYFAAAELLFWRHVAKPLAILFVLLNAGCLYFMVTFRIAIDKIMLINALSTDAAEAADLLSWRMALYLLVGGILPAYVIARINICYAPWRKELFRHTIFVLLSLLLIAAIAGTNGRYTAQFLRNNRRLRYELLPVNYVGAVISTVKILSRSQRQLVTVGNDAKLAPYWQNGKKNLIVLVIGETARAANFSLGGYSRPTNQPLDAVLPDIFYFSDVTACGTSTAVSVPCMLSDKERKKFKAGSQNYTENLLDIAQKSGYSVLWRENNSGCQGTCTRVPTETFCSNYQCRDEILLQDFAAKIRSTDKNTLVVLHQQGSHGPAYYKRYAKEQDVFRPACQTETLSDCSAEEIVNAYDNSLLYTSYMLEQTIRRLQQLADDYNVVMLYASDHGESLGENDIYLHAAPYLIAPDEQVKVPMLLWLDAENAEALQINRQCLRQKLQQPFSHDNIFHTLLGLGGIQTSLYRQDLDILSACRLQK